MAGVAGAGDSENTRQTYTKELLTFMLCQTYHGFFDTGYLE